MTEKGNRYKWIKKCVFISCVVYVACKVFSWGILKVLLVYEEIVSGNTLVELSVFWNW